MSVHFRILSMLISNHVNIIPMHKLYNSIHFERNSAGEMYLIFIFGGGDNKNWWLCVAVLCVRFFVCVCVYCFVVVAAVAAFVSCVYNLYREYIGVHCLQENSCTVHKNWIASIFEWDYGWEREESAAKELREREQKNADFSNGNLFLDTLCYDCCLSFRAYIEYAWR